MRKSITVAFMLKKAENVLELYSNASYYVGYYGVVKNTKKLHEHKELCSIYGAQYRFAMEVLGVKAPEIETALTAAYTPKFNKGQRAGEEYKKTPAYKKIEVRKKQLDYQKKFSYKGKDATLVRKEVKLKK